MITTEGFLSTVFPPTIGNRPEGAAELFFITSTIFACIEITLYDYVELRTHNTNCILDVAKSTASLDHILLLSKEA